jgi:hypothetical protein
MSQLQFGHIQGGRVAFVRRFTQHVCVEACALRVLLETILLVRLSRPAPSLKYPHTGRRGLRPFIYGKKNCMELSSNLTSNDLLLRLLSERPHEAMNYTVIAQSANEVQDIQNAPSVSMGSYLASSGQTRLLTTLSIYSLRGSSREQMRLLYMNGTALRLWRDMGKQPNQIGTQHRPPHTALLSFGVPFSE